jgi:hypothetical protein
MNPTGNSHTIGARPHHPTWKSPLVIPFITLPVRFPREKQLTGLAALHQEDCTKTEPPAFTDDYSRLRDN